MSRERANNQLYPGPPGARIRADRTLGPGGRLAFAVCWALLGVHHAHAQPARTPQATTAHRGSAERARAHFDQAMEHYRERRYREAIHEFRLSLAEVPNADLWFNIGRAHEQLGEYELAIENYRLYLRDRVEAPDAREVEQRVEQLKPRVQAVKAATPRAGEQGALAIKAGDHGVLVRLDGESLGPSPIDRLLQVAPGRHRLEASRADLIPFRAEVEVQPGGLSVAYVDLRQRARPETALAPRFWTWFAAAASAGALLTSGALGVAALERRDAGELADARRLALGSDIALAAGFGLAIGAALLYFIEAEPSEPAARHNASRLRASGDRAAAAGGMDGAHARPSAW
jgi:hypothetical protein